MNNTPEELALLRTYPQQASLSLSVYQPSFILNCNVNDGSITRGARDITYDTVSYGSYANVKAGMVMMVGTALGLFDVGLVRVKSATSTVITIAENSEVLWRNDLWLSVMNFYEILPVFPRIIPDPNNEEQQIFYKDYDIVYTNQNTIMGTLICMGPHREAQISPTTGYAYIDYSSNGTHNVLDEVITYHWEFEGGIITGSHTVANPGMVAYNTPGNYVATLTTTSSSGAVDVSHRYIVINAAGGGVHDWQLVSMQGDRQAGGYTATIKIHSDIGYTLTTGVVMIISIVEKYGDTSQQIGEPKTTFFVGHVRQDSIRYDYKSSSVQFELVSVSEIMKLTDGFATTMENCSVATTWYQVPGLNNEKALYHFLRWHSTVLLTTDVQYVGLNTGGDYQQLFFDTNRQSVYDAIASGLKSARHTEVVSNRCGKLWVETMAAAIPDAPTTYPPEFIIDKDDWIGEPDIKELSHTVKSSLELNGVICTGVTEELQIPAISIAPGHTPAYRGKPEIVAGLSVYSQAQLNALSGDLFCNANYKYPEVSLDMRGTFKIFDIAPHYPYAIHIVPDDTARHITISGSYYPSSMSWKYEHRNNSLLPSVVFSAVTDGEDGSTVIQDGIVPDDVIPDTDDPPIVIPVFPPIPIVPPRPPTPIYPTPTPPGSCVNPHNGPFVAGWSRSSIDGKSTVTNHAFAFKSCTLSNGSFLTFQITNKGKAYEHLHVYGINGAGAHVATASLTVTSIYSTERYSVTATFGGSVAVVGFEVVLDLGYDVVSDNKLTYQGVTTSSTYNGATGLVTVTGAQVSDFIVSMSFETMLNDPQTLFSSDHRMLLHYTTEFVDAYMYTIGTFEITTKNVNRSNWCGFGYVSGARNIPNTYIGRSGWNSQNAAMTDVHVDNHPPEQTGIFQTRGLLYLASGPFENRSAGLGSINLYNVC